MPIQFQMGAERSYSWKCVDLDLNIPYFFVAYEVCDDAEISSMRKIISTERDLLQFCFELADDATSKIRQLSIIAPNWLNQTSRWQMIDIVEIQSAQFPASDTPINVFVNPIGQKITTSMQEINLDYATQIDSIFTVQ